MILHEKYEFLTFGDVLTMFGYILFCVFLSIIIFEILYFIPTFMKSLVKSIKNKSIIEYDEESMDTSLDKNYLAFKFNLDKKSKGK